MSELAPPQIVDDLVLANRILSNEGVLDAFGHVSARHPMTADRFLISHTRAPELVEANDLQLLDLKGARVAGGERRSYEEAAIHAAVYRRRSDVGAVVHSHAPSVIPFGVTGVPLRPIYHMGSVIGAEIPVWDIAERFGETDLLVRDAGAADDLAAALGGRTVVLMRGHGCVVTGTDLRAAVFAAIYLERNATLLTTALQLGEVRALSKAETQRAAEMLHGHAGERAWEYWVRRLSPGKG
ncbi:MAG TPA: class II aldolase/adducin family protein [Candidatus Limnocylindria bacterium]|nr:class II aldolase/adducin family protein [Candidatus Limnocylindria bacterium]